MQTTIEFMILDQWFFWSSSDSIFVLSKWTVSGFSYSSENLSSTLFLFKIDCSSFMRIRACHPSDITLKLNHLHNFFNVFSVFLLVKQQPDLKFNNQVVWFESAHSIRMARFNDFKSIRFDFTYAFHSINPSVVWMCTIKYKKMCITTALRCSLQTNWNLQVFVTLEIERTSIKKKKNYYLKLILIKAEKS